LGFNVGAFGFSSEAFKGLLVLFAFRELHILFVFRGLLVSSLICLSFFCHFFHFFLVFPIAPFFFILVTVIVINPSPFWKIVARGAGG
jgi:hypothetical protein